jgi:hypothetical protein
VRQGMVEGRGDQKCHFGRSVVAHICNPSYEGGGGGIIFEILLQWSLDDADIQEPGGCL